ncbi:unnamed protein product [Callosobruchus maculatus]|uniref:FYVE-type domain-containing protein n=1 Tax=Callosobruchus maculatus TaxID=64391 RepID=A0A653CH10_CALMS|nr:unnamed protein product [Callosobruchus maculatus]
MEKFTIDLDQVLNDFEYKELTDQYISRNVPESRASTANQTEKHTINNVFHSLNEYLNTSIKINSLQPSDNNLTNEIDYNETEAPSCSSVQSSSHSHSELNKKSHSDVSQEGQNCDLNKNMRNFIVGSGEVDIEIVQPTTENGIFVDEVGSGDTLEDCIVTDIPEKQIILEEQHKAEGQNTNPTERKEVCSEMIVLESEHTHLENPEAVTTELKVDELITVENEIVKDDTLTNISQEELEAQIAEEKSKVKIIEAKLIAEIGNKAQGIALSKVPNVSSKIGFDTDLDLDDKEISKLLDELEADDDLKEFESQNDSNTQAQISENVVIEQEPKVQTEHIEELEKSEHESNCQIDSNISDSNCDIERLNLEVVDKTEEEADITTKHTGTASENVGPEDTDFSIVKNKRNDEEVTVDDKPVADIFEEKQNLQDSNTEVRAHNSFEASASQCESDDKHENIDDTEEKESIHTETTNEKVVTHESLHETHDYEVADKNEVSSETVDSEMIIASSDVSSIQTSDTTEQIIPQELNNVIRKEVTDSTSEKVEPNNGIEQSKDTILKQDSSSLEKENSQDSLTRPQNLPLKEVEDTRRSIDLIGGPGSTPYNNVYIDKEIEQTRHDSDTDSSTSSSPSFSDTNSVSTASTEEIQDDDVPITRNQFEKTTEPIQALVTVGVDESGPSEPVEKETLNSSDAPAISESTTLAGGNTASGISSTEEDKPSPSMIPSDKYWLGKEAPLWVPDSDALACLHCDMKFTVLKRRHHCRACGLVLCSKCCHLRFRLEYLDGEGRVCNKCHDILNMRDQAGGGGAGGGEGAAAAAPGSPAGGSSGSGGSPESSGDSRRPNPNNPLEYCSTVSPLQQAALAARCSGRAREQPPPAVMVPIGVLKRKGSNKGKSNKSVMFCDGIRPGSDLTNLDNDFNYNNTKTKKLEKNSTSACAGKINRHLPIIDSQTNTFIPSSENNLPPTVTFCKTEITYTECSNSPALVETLKKEELIFAIHINLYVHLKLINMSCCINKWAWCFSTEGLINVGQDEVVYLIEYINGEMVVPKDVFHHISQLYSDAVKGNSVSELGVSLHSSPNFLDSKNHAGFVYIRPSFQCMENVIKPKDPFVIGILIHRWETPWAKLFPLRLVLRLGAEYRYYPSPIISTRNRDSVFVEIGHTIINLLADFRNFSYSLPQIRGLTIHMEDKNTTVTIPVNRYDQVVKSLNNSSDHILAFAGNFSSQADSHLVCIQDTQGNEDCYSTHAINIQNKPRKITGASFIVFNGALKSTSGLTAKSNIVEDGLMIQVLPEHMQQIRDHLRAMKNHTISCGPVNSQSDETVNIIWGENDVNFNVGIVSAIDGLSLSGIPSMRVHNGKNHVSLNGNRIIRWTEVFVIQSGQENPKNQDPVDVSRISETIAKACCDALVKYLDLLLANSFQKVAVRATLQPDNVSYQAGSNGTKLPPIYMKSLDNELVPVLHRITSSNLGDSPIVLELIFRILNV